MARICIDVMPLTHIVNKNGWYADLRNDIESRDVKVCIALGQYKKEAQTNLKVLMWLNSLSEAGKTVSVDTAQYQKGLSELKGHKACRCKECDDPHLFSLCAGSKAEYLFTEDKRIGKCRRKMNGHPTLKKFCSIRLIYGRQQYKDHRRKVIA